MKLHFDDTAFDGQLQRTAAKASYAACDLGEMFAIVGRITPGDYDSWFTEWAAVGASNRQLADAEAAQGHTESACQAYLRASEYHRSAYFFSRRDPEAEAMLDQYRASRDAFRAAVPHLPYPTEHVQIPYEGVLLDGYVITPRSGPSGPVLLWPAGYDSPVEEGYTLGAVEAAARGFTVLAFEGPGQGGALYELKLPFRHDFEVVTAAVIDFVESRDDLNGRSVGLVGRSFGGYLAPRGVEGDADRGHHRRPRAVRHGCGVPEDVPSGVDPAPRAGRSRVRRRGLEGVPGRGGSGVLAGACEVARSVDAARVRAGDGQVGR